MTDQELIELLEQKTPDELTADEIELLRGRLVESPELREVMIGQLQMETYLTAALGKVELSAEKIVARAQQQHPANSTSVILVIAVLLCLPFVALVGAVLWSALRPTLDEAAIAQAAREKEAKAKLAGETPAGDPDGNSKPETATPETGPAVGKTGNATNPPKGTGDKAGPDKVAPLPANAPPPWHEALEQAGPLPEFTQVAFQTFDVSKALPQVEDLKRWFEAAPGFNHTIRKLDTRFGPCGSLEGVARLKCPWPDNAVLRLAMENHNRLKLHFFAGDVGVSLVYYEEQYYRWAAYATTRDPGKATPKTWALTATDDHRASRAEVRQGGPLELRYHDGKLLLSRGDVVLVSAPLPGPPTDVYFEGRAAFEGISLVRTKGVPAELPPGPVVLEVTRPADLEWKSSKPELIKPEKLADGGVRLAANNLKERCQIYTPLKFEGLHEYLLELSDITAGAGVMLTHEEGKGTQAIRFIRDRKTGDLYTYFFGWDDVAEGDAESVAAKPVPLVRPHCWVRIVVGCKASRMWISSDGQHWAQLEQGSFPHTTQPTGLGLQAVANRAGVQMTLKRLVVRELSGLNNLAPAEVRERAVALPLATSLGEWLSQALAAQPAGVNTGEWLRACAIRTLAAGMPGDLSYQVLETMLDDAVASNLPFDRQQAALCDAALLVTDARDGNAMRRAIPGRLVDLGLAMGRSQNVPAWSAVRHAEMSVPLTLHFAGPVDLAPSVRYEAIQRANLHQPAETLAFCRQLRLFDQARFSPLIDWAESRALRDLPGKPAGESIAKLRDSWRDPLLEELSKETYNVTTELQAVLESEAWDDAARMVTSLNAEAAPGVAPYIKDRGLLASLPVAVRLTLEDYPQLRQALGERFGPLAGLRIGQAMAAGDAATVEMATVQFAGTDAAADAHRWLGDRALASGWFERAIAEYQRAMLIVPSLAVQVAPRIRLAAAMQGRDEGKPVTQPVHFNDLDLSPAEFEALVKEMRGRGDTTTLAVSSGAARSPDAIPAAKKYDSFSRSKLDGPTGNQPQDEVGRKTNQFRVPWADRQIATVVEGDVLYVANRFQVSAYNLASGQRMWQSQPPPGQMQKSQDWALIAMRPLVTGRHIYVRMLYSANPLLVCLEKATGKLLWVAEGRQREYLVSDPIIVQGQLGAVGVALQDDQVGLLKWNTFDPETGELQSQRDLVRLRSTWGARACCELAPLDDAVVAVLGGLTLAFDPAGQVRWVRKHVTVPPEEDPRWVLQLYQRPLVVGERMYVAQPGVRTVDCLDVETGRVHWSAVLPEIAGLVGLSENRLIVRTETEVLALDRAAGNVVWRYAAPEMHSFPQADDKHVLVPLRERSPDKKDQWQTRLVWLDATTGLPSATTALANLVDADPRLGPIVSYKDRVFTFFGKGQHDPIRDVVELVPTGEANKPMPINLPVDPWRARVSQNLLRATWQVLPDWQLLSGQDGDKTGLVGEIHGEKEVLGVRTAAIAPIVLGREIAIPAGGKPRLRLRLGSDAGQQWKVEFRLGNQLLKTEEIKDETHKDRWKTLGIDLTPAAGKSGWLTIRAQSLNGDHALWLKSAEVVF